MPLHQNCCLVIAFSAIFYGSMCVCVCDCVFLWNPAPGHGICWANALKNLFSFCKQFYYDTRCTGNCELCARVHEQIAKSVFEGIIKGSAAVMVVGIEMSDAERRSK